MARLSFKDPQTEQVTAPRPQCRSEWKGQMAHRNRVEHPVWRRGALIAASCAAMLPVTVWPSQAKAPGATWCYRDVCHRVRTVGETQRLVGKTLLLETSYYDEPRLDRFNKGKHTSNGERFDANNPARAAAANFPDGTELLLRNPENGRTSHVRINDFGPFLRSRALDVTKRVAHDLEFAHLGVARLEVTVIAAPPPEEVVYRKNRISLPTRGHLGALEAAEAAEMARGLIADAQDFAPTVASTVPQGERTRISAAGLLASYDLLGRVRSILGLARPQAVAELEREVIATRATATEPAVRDGPPAAQVAELAAEPTRTETGPRTIAQIAITPVEIKPATGTAASIAVATTVHPSVSDAAHRKVALPDPVPAPATLAAALAKAALPLPTLPDMALATLMPRVAPDAGLTALPIAIAHAPETADEQLLLQAALMPAAVAPGAATMIGDLAGQLHGMAYGVVARLAGTMHVSPQIVLLAILALLSTALLLTSRQGRAPRPAAAGAARPRGAGPSAEHGVERARAGENPVAAGSQPGPAQLPPAIPAPDISGSQIGEGITVIGAVTSRGTLTVAGLVRGRVKADTLVILAHGRIEGPVDARVVRCAGSLEGALSANALHLAATARYRGDAAVTTLSMELGATLDADVTHRPAAG